ncbi:two-pore potassium channel 3-like [Olea europaea subsp. europaea]|uniref:Two-pore potassium channel 3-like n=1 Tax=Olea europaea subsp. europaea TaxID=158383 RepID=A0A8S0SXH0_OLEEU|nr:two-pore potassium channel 3-like [Olea europaea subsp. europaea]
MAAINEIDHSHDSVKPQFGKVSIVRKGVVLLIIYLSLGVVIYSFNRNNFRAIETHPIIDVLYFRPCYTSKAPYDATISEGPVGTGLPPIGVAKCCSCLSKAHIALDNELFPYIFVM